MFRQEPSVRPDDLWLDAGSQLPNRQLPAWLLSVVLHLTAVLAIGFLVPAPRIEGGGEADRPAGIVLFQVDGSERQYFSQETRFAEPETALPPFAEPSTSTSATAASPTAIELPTASMPGLPGQAAGVAVSGGTLTPGLGQSSNIAGGQGSTTVFGAQGRGSKFLYVFDRSLSMAGFQGRPMAAARAELIASLSTLQSVHQFQIVFYNEDQAVLNPFPSMPPTMLFASSSNKQLASEFVSRVQPAGGTRHFEALELALNMRPDVIFFLTDAEEPQLSAAQLNQIRRHNAGQTSIHAIEFGSGPFRGGQNFLVLLAKQNSGQHVYVDLTELAVDGP
jgi:hypothetical protein